MQQYVDENLNNCISQIVDFFCPETGPEEDYRLELLSNRTMTFHYFINKEFDVYTTYSIWNTISKNPNITMKHILAEPRLRQNYRALSENPNITLEFIESNVNEDWDWKKLSKNPNMTFNFVIDNLDKDWDWSALNKKVLKIIFAKYKKWLLYKSNINLKDLIKNPNTSIKYIRMLIPKIHKFMDNDDWCNFLIKNPNITMDLVVLILNKFHIYNQHCESIFQSLSKNPNITKEFVIANMNQYFDWHELSKRFSFKKKDFVNWDCLSCCTKNITIEYINKNFRYWNWEELSKNPNITIEFFMQHLDLPWDLGVLNKTITDWILANPDLPWNWQQISRNPNIPICFVMQNSDKDWDLKELSKNVNLNLHTVKKLIIKDYFAVTNILNQLLESFVNPMYMMCVERLKNEFNVLRS